MTFVTDRTYLRDTDQEKTNTFLPLDVSSAQAYSFV